MDKKRVFVVEDEEDILELVRHHLERQGYDVSSALSGEEGLQAITANPPDAVLLDIMLSGLDGIEVCRQLRGQAETKRMPIVMLTARGEEEDIVKGLNAGADDYVTKPFSPKVLMARLKAVLRRNARTGGAESEEVRIHDIVIHAGRHEVRVKGLAVTLTPTEFRLLHYLAQRPGWVFTRNQILVAVHGYGYPATDRSVDVQVMGLRKKLGEAGDYIETLRGVGYRFLE